MRTEPIGDSDWPEKVSHDALIDIRRRYDAAKRDRMQKLRDTEKLKVFFYSIQERLKTYSHEH